MNRRAWLLSSWTGRGLLAVIALKILVFAGLTLAGPSPPLDNLDRLVNLAILVVTFIAIVDVYRGLQAQLLWRVRRKLILSYILIGAVPILLLIAFALLGFLLVFFDVGSYLVQNRINGLLDQASGLARTTLVEIDRSTFETRPDVLARRQTVLETRYPGISLAILPTTGAPRCGLPPSKDLPAPVPSTLPRWVSCRGFSGLLLHRAASPESGSLHLIARAAALPNRANPDYAVLVDLPIDQASTAAELAETGIRLGALRTVAGDSGAVPPPVEPRDAENDGQGRMRSFLNTATFLTYTDWQNGLPGEVALSMNVEVATLYRWLGENQGVANADANFSKIVLVLLAGIGALLLVIEAVALGNGLALARSITDSVDELFQGTVRVKAGDYTRRIPRRTDDQLGELAASFNDMTESVKQAIEERAEKQRLEGELRIARDIQMSLLPDGPIRAPGVSLSACCVPAREVGGDYYDYLQLGDDRFGLLIADVAGKGASAALYMAELKGLMLSLSQIQRSPRALLIEANRIIANHLNDRSFITMTYAVVDTTARTLTCARAGHTPFIQIPGGGGHAARVLAPDGMMLGLNLDSGERFERILEEMTLPLVSGDLFFFFTDGVSEAMDVDGDYYGESRLTGFLESHADLAVDEIRDGLLSELTAFAAGRQQHDDLTMIVMKVEQPEGNSWTS